MLCDCDPVNHPAAPHAQRQPARPLDAQRVAGWHLGQPDFGDAVDILPGEVPVFWACGVTPQSAIRAARPPFSITHKPGCMLVTDLLNARLAVF